jgi:short subunit dehydrogenase-like uncharacterized protein
VLWQRHGETRVVDGLLPPYNVVMKKRVIVIGGAGFLGARVVQTLARRGDVEVLVAGRRGPDRIVDLGAPETFTALGDADVVVNCSSSHAAPPAALVAWCLREGLTLLEASSDRVVVEGLIDAWRGKPAAGTVVLGAGIFTGLSNLLGAAAHRAAPEAVTLDLGVRSSPFSGAGQGTIDLVVDALGVPARAVRGGHRVEVPGALSGETLPFPRGARHTLTFSFPEVAMLAASTGVAAVTMSFAPSPSPLWASFRVLPGWLLVAPWFRALLGVYFRLLRGLVLKRVPSVVEVVARARGPADDVVVSLCASDGFAVGGAAVAAKAMLLLDGRARGRGLVLIDEVCTLDEVVDQLRVLRPDLATTIEHQRTKRP